MRIDSVSRGPSLQDGVDLLDLDEIAARVMEDSHGGHAQIGWLHREFHAQRFQAGVLGRHVIHLEGRNRLGSVLARALALTAVPLVGSWLLGRLLVSHGTHAFTACLIVAGSLLMFGGWRWWTMRL